MPRNLSKNNNFNCVIIGRSGSGKTTIVNELVKIGWNKVVTYTTRPMREGEVNGADYHFVSEEEFEDMDCKGMFLETTSYDASFGKCFYGTPISEMLSGTNNILILNPDGLRAVSNNNSINFASVLVKCTDKETKIRLLSRGDSQEEIERRMNADNYDFYNINSSHVDILIDTAINNVVDCVEYMNEKLSNLSNKIYNCVPALPRLPKERTKMSKFEEYIYLMNNMPISYNSYSNSYCSEYAESNITTNDVQPIMFKNGDVVDSLVDIIRYNSSTVPSDFNSAIDAIHRVITPTISNEQISDFRHNDISIDINNWDNIATFPEEKEEDGWDE